MASKWSSGVVASLLVVACVVPVGAQDDDVQTSANPYQEDVSYRIGDDLTPNVEVDEVRWLGARVAPRKDEEPAPGEETAVQVDLRFDNRGRKGATLIVVLLLEDDNGSELHRLACPEMRLGGNRVKEFRHKLTAPGEALLNSRRMYLFFRVQ